MTIPAPVMAAMNSVRARWCALGKGVVVLCMLLAAAAEVRSQSRPLPPAPATKAAALPPSATAGIDPKLSSVLRRRGGLTLRDTSLPAALFTISEIWQINVVVGDQVQGKVNGVFRNAPLHEILDSILLCNGYGYRPVGQSLVIMPLEDLGDLNPMFESARIPLVRAEAAEVLEGLRLLSSPQGKVHAIPSAKSLIVLDFPDHVARIRKFVEELDAASRPAAGTPAAEEIRPMRVAQFAPQFAAASSLLPAVETLLSKEGKAAVTEPGNRLVITDYPAQIELARQLVEQLDVPRLQVRITALIYDLAVKDVERLGINWNHAIKDRYDAQGDPQSTWNINSVLSVPVSSGLSNGTMTFMNLSHAFDITAVVQALQEAQDSRLLANPNVTVLDHEKAMMSIITEIPYQELTQTQQGGQIGTTAFREAGIKLEVTPHIAADGTIRMEVSPSFSRLTGFTPGQQPQPIIDRREAQTTVRVANRQVLVIGGLRQRNDTGNFNGLPYLKDIRPFNLGALFRGRDTEVRESELVVFIMPEIVAPAHVGALREGVALQHGLCLLDQVPTATGGAIPYRPIPCWPPTPVGGPRVLGTPYQPNTCPPPGFVPVQVPNTGEGQPSLLRLPPTKSTEPPVLQRLPLPPSFPATPQGPPQPTPPTSARPRILGVRVPLLGGSSPSDPLRRSYSERFRGSQNLFPRQSYPTQENAFLSRGEQSNPVGLSYPFE